MYYARRGIKASLGVILLVLLTEGQVAQITGTDLTIAVRAVRDFTAEGCLGGPAGCPDHVELEVMHRKESRQVILHAAQTELQKQQGVDQINLFGLMYG